MNNYLMVVNILPFGQGYTQTRQACVINKELPHALRMRSVEYPVPMQYTCIIQTLKRLEVLDRKVLSLSLELPHNTLVICSYEHM